MLSVPYVGTFNTRQHLATLGRAERIRVSVLCGWIEIWARFRPRSRTLRSEGGARLTQPATTAPGGAVVGEKLAARAQRRKSSFRLSGPGVPSGIVCFASAAGCAAFLAADFFLPPFAAFGLAAFAGAGFSSSAPALLAPVAANLPGSVFLNRDALPFVVSS